MNIRCVSLPTLLRQLSTVLLGGLLTAALSQAVLAHETGVATLTLDLADADQPILAVELDVLDVELAVGLDGDGDGSILWQEYTAQTPSIQHYIQQALTLSVLNNDCALVPTSESSGVRQGAAPSIITEFKLNCPAPIATLSVDNRLLQDVDSSATALFVVLGSGAEKSLAIPQGETRIELAGTGFLAALGTYISLGMHHILQGADHLVFLLLLLLPAARSGSLKARLLTLTGIVTSFTLAHSITLTLSTAGYLTPPARAVEVVIAGTVVLVALLNLIKPKHQASWVIAYCFGLVHGFGFASALADMTVSSGLRAANLAAFNIGVELGQLGFVLLVFPLLCLLSAHTNYTRYVVTPLSLAIALAGGFWMVQRLA